MEKQMDKAFQKKMNGWRNPNGWRCSTLLTLRAKQIQPWNTADLQNNIKLETRAKRLSPTGPRHKLSIPGAISYLFTKKNPCKTILHIHE